MKVTIDFRKLINPILIILMFSSIAFSIFSFENFYASKLDLRRGHTNNFNLEILDEKNMIIHRSIAYSYNDDIQKQNMMTKMLFEDLRNNSNDIIISHSQQAYAQNNLGNAIVSFLFFTVCLILFLYNRFQIKQNNIIGYLKNKTID